MPIPRPCRWHTVYYTHRTWHGGSRCRDVAMVRTKRPWLATPGGTPLAGIVGPRVPFVGARLGHGPMTE
jgi:hypothetical protein